MFSYYLLCLKKTVFKVPHALPSTIESKKERDENIHSAVIYKGI